MTNHYMQIAILNDVVGELEKDPKQSKHQGAIYAAIDNYNQRLENLILEQESNNVKEELANIRVMIMEIERKAWNMLTRRARFLNSNITLSTLYQGLERRINRGFVSSLSLCLRCLCAWPS